MKQKDLLTFKALALKAKKTRDSYDIKHALDFGITKGISLKIIRGNM